MTRGLASETLKHFFIIFFVHYLMIGGAGELICKQCLRSFLRPFMVNCVTGNEACAHSHSLWNTMLCIFLSLCTHNCTFSHESTKFYASGLCCWRAGHLIPPLGELLTFSRPNPVNQYQLEDSLSNGRHLETLYRLIQWFITQTCTSS